MVMFCNIFYFDLVAIGYDYVVGILINDGAIDFILNESRTPSF